MGTRMMALRRRPEQRKLFQQTALSVVLLLLTWPVPASAGTLKDDLQERRGVHREHADALEADRAAEHALRARRQLLQTRPPVDEPGEVVPHPLG